MKLSTRLSWVLGYTLYFVIFYKGIQFFIESYGNPFANSLSLELPGEKDIPFWPPFFIIYICAFVVPVVVIFLLKQKEHIIETIKLHFIISIIHFLFFILIPVQYPYRPELEIDWASPLLSVIAIFHTLDSPLNNFPSLHVSFPFLGFFIFRKYLPHYSRAMLIVAIAIAFSTVVVKQHFIVDSVAAFMLAWAINILFIETWRHSDNEPT